MANSIEKLRQTGQSIWYDNISRKMIATGDLQQLIDNGITGLTSNPTIFQKAIAETSDYDQAISKLDRKTPAEIFEKLGIEDIQQAADMLTPIYEKSGRVDGYASFEVNPHLAHDTGLTVIEGKKLFDELDRPNVMIKVPATPEGMPAITELIGAGVNVNVTLIFSLSAYHQVMDAYIAGLEELDRRGGDVSKIGSVASFLSAGLIQTSIAFYQTKSLWATLAAVSYSARRLSETQSLHIRLSSYSLPKLDLWNFKEKAHGFSVHCGLARVSKIPTMTTCCTLRAFLAQTRSILYPKLRWGF